MRAVLQRVLKSSVSVDGKVVGKIGQGLNILLGVEPSDTEEMSAWLAEKVANLRIFEDDAGKMNKSVLDIGGSALVISQFTLYADCDKGRRPSFIGAAGPDQANHLYEVFIDKLKAWNLPVECGVFQAEMKVEILNDGPVTVIVNTPAKLKEKQMPCDNPLGLNARDWKKFGQEADSLKRNLNLRKEQGAKNGKL